MNQNENIWKYILIEIEQKVKPVIFFTWFKDTKLINLNDDTATIEVPYNIHKEILKNDYNKLIKDVVNIVTGKTINVEYQLCAQSKDIIFDPISTNELGDKNINNIFGIFEKEFNRMLTPMEYEIINAWIKKGFDEKTIVLALKEISKKGLSNLKYIDKILYEDSQK